MKQSNQGHNSDKPVLILTINGKQYEWHHQYITGEQIRTLAAIEQSAEISLKIKDPWPDEIISDDTNVDLARPGIEHFVSKEKCKDVFIFVNGHQKKWDKKVITFREVVILAYGSYNDNPTTVYTVAYEDGPKENHEGSLLSHQEVFVKDKMIFHATCTDKS